MALTAMKGKARRKKSVTFAGRLQDDMKHYGGLPMFNDNMTDKEFENEFNRAVNMYACVGSGQERAKAAKAYIKATRKKDLKHIQKLPDSLLIAGLGTYCRVWEFSGKFTKSGQKFVDDKIEGLIKHAKSIKVENTETIAKQPTPAERTLQKVRKTIIQELEDLEDSWINGEKTDINFYERCQAHDIKGSSIGPAEEWIQARLNDYEDAYHKRDDDAVEGYSHIKRTELKRYIKVLQTALDDCERVKAATKATRKTRIKKAPTADKQVAKLKYLKDSNEHKIVSVNPLTIIGAKRVLVFNTKNRKIEEYTTERHNGFEVKGQALQHINGARGKLLRKPEEFLPIALKKTPTQFKKEFDKLTTKEYKPNGRFNDKIVILYAK